MYELFNLITQEHIDWEKVPQEKQRLYKEQARTINDFEFFNWIVGEMIREAEKKMFYESTDFNGMIGGKAMLYTLDVLKKKVEKIAKLQI